MIAAIVAVDSNWGIGRNGDLLVNIPKDKKYFKEKTDGSIVIMGRKTWESLPQKPLKNRLNIVLTRDENYIAEDAIVVCSIEPLIEFLSQFKNAQNIFVIGGSQIYSKLLPYCDEVYLTKIYGNYGADTYFPNINKMEEWKIKEYSETEYSDTFPPYQFITYEKQEVN